MSRPEKIFKIEATILVNRPERQAILIEVFGEKIWIPRSQLFDEELLPEKGEAEIKMSEWIAEKTGLL